jgi:hypothetical protein
VAGLAAEQGSLFGVEQKAAADLGSVSSVALVAVLNEYGADVFLEESELIRWQIRMGRRWLLSGSSGCEGED